MRYAFVAEHQSQFSKTIAAALLPKAAVTGRLTLEDQKLLQMLKTRLTKDDTSARKLREAILAFTEPSVEIHGAFDAA